MKIIADELIPGVQTYFARHGELTLKPGRSITVADLVDADVLLVRAVTKVDAALLQQSSVRLVGSVTAGVDHIDTAWLAERGIAFVAAEGFNAPPVADYVVSVLAALQRKQLFPQFHARAAVIGVGHVGKLVAKHLQTLGIETLLCDPLRAKNESDFPHVALNEIADVDLVSLHVPLTSRGESATYHMINHSFLMRQKPGCVLLNAARGAVVNSRALFEAALHLQWCLDVFENEPHIEQAVLEHAVIATPHIAGYSVQAQRRGVAMVYRKMCELGIIEATDIVALQPALPRQRLSFAGAQHHWQDIVLGIFNPLLMTAMMRSAMSEPTYAASAFDRMRQQFNYRHEFAYTDITSEDLLTEDNRILNGLGATCGRDDMDMDLIA